MTQYLGIDWGEKRIGLALGDGEIKIAIPFKTVSSFNELLQVIKDEEINFIILGSPQKMSGASANNPDWLKFVALLKEKISCPLVFLDERLSSLAADALSGSKKTKAGRDEIAASIILQNYFDKRPV